MHASCACATASSGNNGQLPLKPQMACRALLFAAAVTTSTAGWGGGAREVVAAAPTASLLHEQVSVLPGGALQIDGGGGSLFVLCSVFTSAGPRAHHLGPAANATDGSWRVTVDSSRAAAGVWSAQAPDPPDVLGWHCHVPTRVQCSSHWLPHTSHLAQLCSPADPCGLHAGNRRSFPTVSREKGGPAHY